VQVTWKVPGLVQAGVVQTSPRSLRCPDAPPKLGAPGSDLVAPRSPTTRRPPCSTPIPATSRCSCGRGTAASVRETFACGWQTYWLLVSTLVVLAAVGVSNLYVQGGMFLRHIAWLGLFLCVYDIVFTLVIPLTPRLADTFEGQPLDAAFGFYWNGRQADIGLGDMLVYSLFAIGAYLWLRRQGPERTTGEWFRQQDEAGRVPLRATRRASPSPEPVG